MARLNKEAKNIIYQQLLGAAPVTTRLVETLCEFLERKHEFTTDISEAITEFTTKTAKAMQDVVNIQAEHGIIPEQIANYALYTDIKKGKRAYTDIQIIAEDGAYISNSVTKKALDIFRSYSCIQKSINSVSYASLMNKAGENISRLIKKKYSDTVMPGNSQKFFADVVTHTLQECMRDKIDLDDIVWDQLTAIDTKCRIWVSGVQTGINTWVIKEKYSEIVSLVQDKVDKLDANYWELFHKFAQALNEFRALADAYATVLANVNTDTALMNFLPESVTQVLALPLSAPSRAVMPPNLLAIINRNT